MRKKSENNFVFYIKQQIPREEEKRIDDLLERSKRCVNLRKFWLGPFHCFIVVLNPEYIKVIAANAGR